MPADRRITWNSAADVASRLNHTLVMYKKLPVYLSHEFRERTGTDVSIDGYNTKTRDWVKDLDVNSADFDCRSPELGYFNSKSRSALYALRMPVRKSVQGLSTQNVVYHNKEPGARGGPYASVNKDTLASQAFAEMLLDEYPSLEQAIKKVVDKQVVSAAFSKKLCIQEDEIGLYKLHFQTRPIAVFNTKKERFFVSERFEHFVPLLAEFGVDAEIT